ncbi:MAG: class I SAM-dependent methyltransferase [Syntrophobacterales bacterium]|nr:MAG: class I SAM-dependent methyltransferase [Syntrophobacterales bacterium]
MLKDQMEKIYRSLPPDTIPWNLEAVPDILQDIVKAGTIKPCKVIELGCGVGRYVRYFSSKGFDATGVECSDSALALARDSALEEGAHCRFIAADVLGEMAEVQDTFDFAYDWELLHHIFPPDRERYMRTVCQLLNPGGYYLSVCFSEQSPQFGGVGKYRKTPLDTILYFSSEDEIKGLVKPLFEIKELKTVAIKGKSGFHTVIYALLRKREDS